MINENHQLYFWGHNVSKNILDPASPFTFTHSPALAQHLHPLTYTHSPAPAHLYPLTFTHAPLPTHLHPLTCIHSTAPTPLCLLPCARSPVPAHLCPLTFTHSPDHLHPLTCAHSLAPTHLYPLTYLHVSLYDQLWFGTNKKKKITERKHSENRLNSRTSEQHNATPEGDGS